MPGAHTNYYNETDTRLKNAAINCRAARTARKLTVRQLANRSGVSESIIREYEAGHMRFNAYSATIIQLAITLNVSTDFILGLAWIPKHHRGIGRQ